jgi:hypothetical protein
MLLVCLTLAIEKNSQYVTGLRREHIQTTNSYVPVVGRSPRKPPRQKQSKPKNKCARKRNGRPTKQNMKDVKLEKKPEKKRNEGKERKNNDWVFILQLLDRKQVRVRPWRRFESWGDYLRLLHKGSHLPLNLVRQGRSDNYTVSLDILPIPPEHRLRIRMRLLHHHNIQTSHISLTLRFTTCPHKIRIQFLRPTSPQM